MTETLDEKKLAIVFWVTPILLFSLLIVFGHFNESFWLDESITAWITNSDLKSTITRSLEFQGQSPLYYVVIYYAQIILGPSEFVTRLPSIIATFLSVLVMAKIVRLFSESLLLQSLGCVVLLSCDAVVKALMSARPYSFSLLFILLSFYFLLRWINSNCETSPGNLRTSSKLSKYQIGYFASCAISIYTHYFCIFLIPSHFFLILALSSQRKVLIVRWILLQLIVLGAIAPLFEQMSSLDHRSSLLSFSSPFNLADLAIILFPLDFRLYVGFALIALLIGTLPRFNFDIGINTIRIGAVSMIWLIVPVVLLALLSNFLEVSLMKDRYFIIITPAIVLGVCTLVKISSNFHGRLLFYLVFATLSMTFRLEGRSRNEGWREAIREVENSKSNAVILLHSGLIETQSVKWLSEPRNYQYSLSPLLAYNSNDPALSLPLSTEISGAKNYYESAIFPKIIQYSDIFIIGRDISLRTSNGSLVSSGSLGEIVQILLPIGYKIINKRTWGQVNLIQLQHV